MIDNDTINVRVYPNKLILLPKKNENTIQQILNKQVNNYISKNKIISYTNNFKSKKNPFILSKTSRKKLIQSINNIYTLSNKRHIKMKNGKHIYNFKTSFITLTLPSKQIHTDKYIKNKCLNQLFIELKKHYNMNNYVWKAELQKNKNIHFHIITDSYIDYQALRRRWNRIINKLGYVDTYKNKMNNLTLNEYHKLRNKYGRCTFNKSKEAYIKGKKSKWNNPNSVDIRSVNNKKTMLSYLSKYISKNEKNINIDDELNERQITFGRSWSRSQSLSKIKNSMDFNYSEFISLLHYFNNKCTNTYKVVNNFCTVFYYNLDRLPKYIYNFIYQYVELNSKVYVYSSA